MVFELKILEKAIEKKDKKSIIQHGIFHAVLEIYKIKLPMCLFYLI